MSRPWQIWLTFAACLTVVVAAVSWLSFKALESDAAESTARRQASQEENIRLALWRMDSQIAPIVAQESARPYFVYNPFYSAERAYGRMFNQGKSDADVTIPSPFLAQPDSAEFHFQLEPQNRWSSPQVPFGKFKDLAVPKYLSEAQYEQNRNRLSQLQTESNAAALTGMFSPSGLEVRNAPAAGNVSASELAAAANVPNEPQQAASMQQNQRGQMEFQARQKSVEQSNVAAQKLSAGGAVLPNPSESSLPGMQVSEMKPGWLGGNLVFARRLTVGGQEYIQGCLLDWPTIKKQLLDAVADLLPHADLMPDASDDPASVRRLASIPVQLLPGPLPESINFSLSPVKLSLWIAWSAILIAALAAAILLHGVIALSERRAAFVSAVTHELRTPLTTFRMYAEMLSEGMVSDESQRRSYFETLRAEADRLSHLVANVLAYARLERGRPGGRIETVAIEKLLEVATQRLATRAAQANLQLTIDPVGAMQRHLVRADPAVVEQILFNLVDNACKYAATARDRTLHLAVAAENGQAKISLRDHGPGISSAEQRRLFQPFHKSSQDAARSAPGVGLGLALSRRLARDMGGELRYETASDGACFTLTLPTASPNS